MNMTINTPISELNAINRNSLMEQLGIEYTKVEEGLVEARMPVDKRTMQPIGILHGGATLAFAETIGGLGSALMIDSSKFHAVGSQVSANHVGMAKSGYVYGKATLIHGGKRTHVWNIDVFTEEDKLVSSVRLTNMIIEH